MALPTKFRFPSEEVFDIVRTRFRLDESPLVQAIAYVGEGREPTGATLEDGSPEYRPTAGFLVDIMWGDGLPDVPDRADRNPTGGSQQWMI